MPELEKCTEFQLILIQGLIFLNAMLFIVLTMGSMYETHVLHLYFTVPFIQIIFCCFLIAHFEVTCWRIRQSGQSRYL